MKWVHKHEYACIVDENLQCLPTSVLPGNLHKIAPRKHVANAFSLATTLKILALKLCKLSFSINLESWGFLLSAYIEGFGLK